MSQGLSSSSRWHWPGVPGPTLEPTTGVDSAQLTMSISLEDMFANLKKMQKAVEKMYVKKLIFVDKNCWPKACNQYVLQIVDHVLRNIPYPQLLVWNFRSKSLGADWLDFVRKPNVYCMILQTQTFHVKDSYWCPLWHLSDTGLDVKWQLLAVLGHARKEAVTGYEGNFTATSTRAKTCTLRPPLVHFCQTLEK